MQGYVDDWKMSPAVLSGDFLFLTGMTGAGPDGNISPQSETQIELAFARADDALKSAGLSFANVVEMTSYHVGIRDHIDAFRKIRAQYVTEPYPAWTAIEVSGFVTPGTICELRIIAHRGPQNDPA
jgi:enamine deaminase RidA (YjgF/YER057c/UK114 family)